MALNRYYTKEGLFRILDRLEQKEDVDKFLESIASVIPAINDYDFASSLILKLLLKVHGDSCILDSARTQRISDLFGSVLMRNITNIDIAAKFLSSLTNGKPEFSDVLKEARPMFACKLHHVIHNVADMEAILSLLKDNDKIPFVFKQNNYWFVYQRECRLAFLSGRLPKYADTHSFFGRLDRNLVIKILREADLLPRLAVESDLKKLKA